MVGFVRLLLQEFLDQLLDHPLDLLERVLRNLECKRRQDRALELLPLRRQQRQELVPLEGVVVWIRELADQLLLQRATTLTGGLGLLGHGRLEHRERLRERRELVRPHLRPLVPQLRLRLALLREVLEVNAVIVQHRGRLGQVSLRRRDVLARLSLLLLLVLERLLGLRELVQLRLHRQVVVAVCGLVVRLERGLPFPEGAQKPLEGLDDAARFGVVVARRYVRDGLVLGQEHRDDLPALRRHVVASAMSRLVRTIDLIWARLTPVAAFNVSIARSREEIAFSMSVSAASNVATSSLRSFFDSAICSSYPAISSFRLWMSRSSCARLAWRSWIFVVRASASISPSLIASTFSSVLDLQKHANLSYVVASMCPSSVTLVWRSLIIMMTFSTGVTSMASARRAVARKTKNASIAERFGGSLAATLSCW